MDELKKFLDSDMEAITKEAGSKPAPQPKPDAVDKEYTKLSDEAIKLHGQGQKLSPDKQKRYDEVKSQMSAKAKANPQPAPTKPTYTPFKLDTKKYADVETTPYGFIYNVGGQSITDLAEQKRAFEGDKFDSSKKYGFSRTTDSGDEVVHESFEDAYNAIKGKSANKNNISNEMKKSIIDDVWSKYSKTPKDVVAKIAEEENYNQDKIEERLVNDPNVVGSNNYKKPQVQAELTDEDLLEELVDNKYFYENARNEEEVAQWLAERKNISPEKASAFVKANYKNGEIWNEEAPKSIFKTTLRKAGDSVKLEDGTEAKVVKYYEDSDDYLVRTADGSTYTYDGYELDRFADPDYNYDEIQDEYEDTASRIVNTPENFGIDKSLIQKIKVVQEQGNLDELEKIVTENLQIGDSEEDALENALTNFETNKGQIVDQSQEGAGKDSRIGTTEWFREQGEKGYGLSEVQTKLGRQLNMSEYNNFIYPKMLKFYDEYKEMGLSDDKVKDEMYDAFGNWNLIDRVFKEKGTMSPAESFLKTNDNLNQRVKEERIDINLLQSKLDNYNNTGDVRAIVDGDVGNFNGLSNGEIMDLLDAFGYDYELKPSKTGKGKTIYYIPRKK